MYDLMIIGSGPAGLTASVYAARKRLNTLHKPIVFYFIVRELAAIQVAHKLEIC